MKKHNLIDAYKQLKEKAWCGIWGKRILSEMYYLIALDEENGLVHRPLLEQAMDTLCAYVEENGAITREIALQLEELLAPMAPLAKELRVILVGHAHIDMNWMWGFQETAALTIDTFKTMLQLMEEYPQFTFSQSQASVYRIVEEYAPHLLEPIRQRIKEGRWEVNATTWVENDKNMSGSEAMARHILYSKEYLSRLLDLPEEEFTLDFEPDTFGHNENMPEILSQGGVKYYYHCRGYKGEFAYRWQAPSGAEVLVYREPMWYNDMEANYDSFGYVPSMCRQCGMKTALKFYGVGDHGGGPTRREIENWLEMQTWPLMPVLEFGTLKQFFRELEKVQDTLPVVRQDLNYVFTGCYTSQARIKRANKIGEDRLYESEFLDAAATVSLPDYRRSADFTGAWEKVLFNQFHDILPGSGVRETGEYALSEFQRAMAVSQINQKHAMTEICGRINTGHLGTEEGSQGGGAGFGTNDIHFNSASYAEQGGGIRRIFTVFNPTPTLRKEPVKVVLWDWPGNAEQMYATDVDGNEVPCQVIDVDVRYWSHDYHTVQVMVEVPPMGYSTYLLDQRAQTAIADDWGYFYPPAVRAERREHFTDEPLVLENDRVKAVFSPSTMKLLSFVDKETGVERIKEPSCFFQLVTEDTSQRMVAWRIGTSAKVVDLNETHPVRVVSKSFGTLNQNLVYKIPFENSSLKATVSLAKGSTTLEFELSVDWHELGTESGGVPRLNFQVPLGYEAKEYLCGVPFGVQIRQPLEQDVPCTGFMAAEDSRDGKALCLMSDSKYGFRGCGSTLGLSLIRSPFYPDPTPDQGSHNIRLGLSLAEGKPQALAAGYERFVHPLIGCTSRFHDGDLPLSTSFLRVTEGIGVQAVKQAQDGNGIIVRLQNLTGTQLPVQLELFREVQAAAITDVLERETEKVAVNGKVVAFDMAPGTMRSVRVVL